MEERRFSCKFTNRSFFQANLDSMLQWVLQNHHTEAVVRVGLCAEAAVLLLEMVKATMSRVSVILGLVAVLRMTYQQRIAGERASSSLQALATSRW